MIFHFKDAPHPARFDRARLRAAKRSALAAVAIGFPEAGQASFSKSHQAAKREETVSPVANVPACMPVHREPEHEGVPGQNALSHPLASHNYFDSLPKPLLSWSS